MDRTTGANYALISGKRSFTGGPPGTALDQQFLNGIQEEIVGAIEAAGLAASTLNTSQLLQAIPLLQTNMYTNWIDVPYNASDFIHSTVTWTVQASDVTVFRYCVVGKIMFMQCVLQNTSISASTVAKFNIKIPGGWSAAYNTFSGDGFGNDAVAYSHVFVQTKSADIMPDYLAVFRDLAFSQWDKGASNNIDISLNTWFEIL